MKCLYCNLIIEDERKFIKHAESCMLISFANSNYATFRSLESRKLPYYGLYRKFYKDHWMSFKGMHKRGVESNLSFCNNFEGFIKFIYCIGDVPIGMAKPTIGRVDHSIGYIKGNFTWQEFMDNVRESGYRNANKHRNHCKFLPNYKKRQALLEFIAHNHGKFHMKYIWQITGYKNGRGIMLYVNDVENGHIENYKNRDDFYVVLE